MAEAQSPLPRTPYQYDPQRRARAKAYSRGRLRQGLIVGGLLPLLIHGAALLGPSAALARWAGSVVTGPLTTVALYLLVYTLTLSLVALPLAYVVGYRFERKFELSVQTPGSWLWDWAKRLVLLLLIGVPVGVGLYALIALTPWWWLLAALLYGGFTAVLAASAPTLLVRWFYTLRPLQDTDQQRRLLALCARCGAPAVRRVMVLGASAKTRTANAAFTGMGPRRTLILTDTMLQQFHPDEVEAVVAHELGHEVHRDVGLGLLLQAVLAVPVLWVVAQVLLLGVAAAGTTPADVAFYPLLHLALEGIMLALAPLVMARSRAAERAADAFAVTHASVPVALASALRRLADLDLADEMPPALARALSSHPPIGERVRSVEEHAQRPAPVVG